MAVETEAREGAPQKSYRDILKEEISAGLTELNRSASGLFLSAISAGLDAMMMRLPAHIGYILRHDRHRNESAREPLRGPPSSRLAPPRRCGARKARPRAQREDARVRNRLPGLEKGVELTCPAAGKYQPASRNRCSRPGAARNRVAREGHPSATLAQALPDV